MSMPDDRPPREPAPAPAAGRRSFVDPQALFRIKSLQLRARAAVEGFLKGIHRSPYHGYSVEFSEYRPYTEGDDVRGLDWRLYARTDRYYVKKFEDETNLRCHLVVDSSRSMGYASGEVTKGEYARTAAATIAYFLNLQRDAVGLALFEDRIVDYLPPRNRPGQLRRIMGLLDREPKGAATNLVGPLDELAANVKRRGLVVLISDLLAPASALKEPLSRLHARGHEVILLRVLDPAEVDFTFETPARFRDVESGRDLFIDPSSARAGYLAKFRAHADELTQICDGMGFVLRTMTTDSPLELALFDVLRSRMLRLSGPSRRTAPGRGGRA